MTRFAFATLALGLAVTVAAEEPSTLPQSDRANAVTFKQVDRNGDGRINRDESAAIEGLDFASADANDDRMLSRPEFAAAVARSDGLLPFARADKNRDGKIDRKEAGEIDGFNFKSADSDRDQALNPAEFRMAMLESRKRG